MLVNNCMQMQVADRRRTCCRAKLFAGSTASDWKALLVAAIKQKATAVGWIMVVGCESGECVKRNSSGKSDGFVHAFVI
jgi:hypothetical protein